MEKKANGLKYGTVLRVLDYLLLAVAVGFQLMIPCLILFEWKFPRVYDWKMFFIVFGLLLLPLVIILSAIIVSKLICNRVMRGIGVLAATAVVLFMFPTAFSGLFTPFESYTGSFENYRDSDDELIEVHPFLNELLPKLLESKKDKLCNDSDAVYHYRKRAALDSTVEILAEWSLEESEFSAETARAERLFEAYEYYEGDDGYCTYTAFERGGYRCLVRYSERGTPPFEKAEGDYSYYIFAYNEELGKVRYIYNYSGENGYVQPFFVDLEW